MDTGSFIIPIITEDLFKAIADDVKKRFGISKYNEDNERPLPVGMNKKVIGFSKDELGWKIMIVFVALRPKRYSYLRSDDNCHKKARVTKKWLQRLFF